MSRLFKQPKMIALIVAGVLGIAMAVKASTAGWGLAPVMKQPHSIREGSVHKSTSSGHYRTHYFVGGGLHGGK